jgi:hypothetical protein
LFVSGRQAQEEAIFRQIGSASDAREIALGVGRNEKEVAASSDLGPSLGGEPTEGRRTIPPAQPANR